MKEDEGEGDDSIFEEEADQSFKGYKTDHSLVKYPNVKNRKEAFRAPKIKELNGHEFIFKYFKYPIYCSFCKEFLWYDYFFKPP
jgi:hypothetical protein